ncbi:MAG: carboxypeptidase-like regulatory domain-containing protein, partial [Pyrinomonadaceae bacterium]
MNRKFTRMVSSMFTALMLMWMLVVQPSSALAQTANSGVITGVVKNEKGELVPNATVRAINVGTNATRSATTSDEGVYELAQLTPGTYRVEVEAQGFSRYVQENVVVNVLQRTT